VYMDYKGQNGSTNSVPHKTGEVMTRSVQKPHPADISAADEVFTLYAITSTSLSLVIISSAPHFFSVIFAGLSFQ
jgi:hypothetical protein